MPGLRARIASHFSRKPRHGIISRRAARGGKILENLALQAAPCSPYFRAHDDSRYQLFECQHHRAAGDLCFHLSVHDSAGSDAATETGGARRRIRSEHHRSIVRCADHQCVAKSHGLYGDLVFRVDPCIGHPDAETQQGEQCIRYRENAGSDRGKQQTVDQ